MNGDEKKDPLIIALLILTFVTGVVDAVSVLALGHVFTANMTGNVVFLAFAAAGAPGFSIGRSSTSLIAFLAGAVIGGCIIARMTAWRTRIRRASFTATAYRGADVIVGVSWKDMRCERYEP